MCIRDRPKAGHVKEWITSAAVTINLTCVNSGRITLLSTSSTVSYTHLDVYKRQDYEDHGSYIL